MQIFAFGMQEVNTMQQEAENTIPHSTPPNERIRASYLDFTKSNWPIGTFGDPKWSSQGDK